MTTVYYPTCSSSTFSTSLLLLKILFPPLVICFYYLVFPCTECILLVHLCLYTSPTILLQHSLSPNFPYATQKSPPVATIVNTNERLAKVIVNASNVFPYIAIVTIS